MLLEKLRQHGYKIMFFALNVSVVFAGVLFVKNKNNEKVAIANSVADAQNRQTAVDYALEVQKQIQAYRETKVDDALKDIAKNPDTVTKQQTTKVTRTIPAVTKTVTVQQPASTSSSKASTPKATTKKS